MKNTKRKLKTMALMVSMAVGVLLPRTVGAQDLFSGNPINNQTFGVSNGGNITNQMFGISAEANITNQTFGNSTESTITNQTFGVPLGSGLLIMLAAGAGYASLKRKKS